MTSEDTALGSPYRVVRAIRAREDGPWSGVLVRTTAGDSRVLVDAESFGPDWRGWDAPADGHLLAPLDIARRADGHDVVLPVCVERLDDFLRRRSARMPLTPGEAVTLGVGLLRGCEQIAGAVDATGEWWLDDAGRPVLATDVTDERALDAAATALELVSVDPALRRTWQTALRAVTAERVSAAELAACEDALFAVAEAEPLGTISLSPRSAVDGSVRSPAGVDGTERPQPHARPRWQSLIAGMDDDLADSVSRATTAVWRGLRRREASTARTRRKSPWVVGGAVAAAVLAGGTLWPAAGGVATVEPGTSSTEPVTSATEPAAPPPAAGQPSPSGVDAAGDANADLAVVTAALLDARLACSGETECLSAVAVDPATITGGVIDLPGDARSVTLLDDFGDVAVVRVDADPASGPSQLVVILRRDGKWLLRDVHDVAQQP